MIHGRMIEKKEFGQLHYFSLFQRDLIARNIAVEDKLNHTSLNSAELSTADCHLLTTET